MKSKSLILSCILVLAVAQFLLSRLGIPLVQARIISDSINNIYLPLALKSGTSPIPSDTPTGTSTQTNTLTESPTSTQTPTDTPTFTPTLTNSPTATFTQTNTPTYTFTPTNTPTFTSTQTYTLTASPTLTNTPTSTPTINGKPPLYRFGVPFTRRPPTDYIPFDFTSMRFGWYVDYHVTANAPIPYGMEYVPTIRVKQLKLAADGVTKVICRYGPYYVSPPEYIVSPSISQIQSMASSHPGLTWLVGNEIERIDWTSGSTCDGQDEILPELYARAYHDIYTAIKSVDPTAKVANGSLVEFTPLRQEYLNRVWAEYQRLYNTNMPVDVWNMHFFNLQEIKGSWGAEIPAGLTETSGLQITFPDGNWDFTIMWSQIVALRTWMTDHDQKEKPLFITEYGTLYPYSYFSCYDSSDQTACPRQARDQMMYPSFDAFLNQADANIGDSLDGNHLVQRWIWWSADYDDGTCENGTFYETFGGALYNSGLGPSSPPVNCTFPSQGITMLGTYWKQYVQNLP
jgi:hypothetical protein